MSSPGQAVDSSLVDRANLPPRTNAATAPHWAKRTQNSPRPSATIWPGPAGLTGVPVMQDRPQAGPEDRGLTVLPAVGADVLIVSSRHLYISGDDPTPPRQAP